MSTTITLNCWIFGEDPAHAFPVKIERTESVGALKDAIKKKKKHAFRGVDANVLVLWKVSIPADEDLREKLEKLNLGGNHPLWPFMKLSSLFADQPVDDHLQVDIVVEAPTVTHRSPDPQLLQLNCLVLGEPRSRIFSVEIVQAKTVADLKDAVKEKKRPTFDHLPADALVLWKISTPIDESLQESLGKLDFVDRNSLLPEEALSEVLLGTLPQKNLHIIIGRPPASSPIKYSLPATPQSVDSLGDLRRTYMKKFPKKSPSQLAQPSQVKDLQTSAATKPGRFHCNRPPSAAPTIPITLLHPVFNEFIEDCQTHQPTQEDNALALELSSAMSGFFKGEKARQTEFIRILGKHGIHITPAEIVGTSYCTDGDMRLNGYPYLIVEIKLEMGSKGSEPVFQPAIYYVTHLRTQEHLNPHFAYPCLVSYLIGTTLGFAGLAFTDGAHVQVLGPAIRLDYHHTDPVLPTMAARYLGALRIATDKLRRHYIAEVVNLEPTHSSTARDARFPCYTRYTCLMESVCHDIQYTFQPFQDKLIFVGTSNGVDVCVKFVTNYSKEAHEHCASQGVAPKLRGFEALPGGWFMVVMDCIAKEFVRVDTMESALTSELHDMVLKEIGLLHQAGYVHGDLRDTNLMVREGAEHEFMFLDFDWAGAIGEIRYPRNVNTGPDLWRPADAYDGELIKAEHDIAMVRHMFRAQ